MTRFFSVLTFCLLLLTPASAAEFHFSGHFIIKGATGPCPDWNPTGYSSSAVARFLVPGEPDRPDTVIIVHTGRAMNGWRLANGTFNASWKLAESFSVFDDWFEGEELVWFHTPNPFPAINANTSFLNIVGYMLNWGGQPGCRINFHLTLTQTPL